MLRVGDLRRWMTDFYTRVMTLLRTTERPEQGYSFAFVGLRHQRCGPRRLAASRPTCARCRAAVAVGWRGRPTCRDRALGRRARPRLEAALALLGDDGDPVQHALARIDLSRELDPREAATLFRSVFERAEASELFGAASKALLYEIEAVLRAGDDLARVTALAVEAEQRFETRSPIELLPRRDSVAALSSARRRAKRARLRCCRRRRAGCARSSANACPSRSRFVPTPPAGQPSAARERRLRVQRSRNAPRLRPLPRRSARAGPSGTTRSREGALRADFHPGRRTAAAPVTVQ